MKQGPTGAYSKHSMGPMVAPNTCGQGLLGTPETLEEGSFPPISSAKTLNQLATLLVLIASGHPPSPTPRTPLLAQLSHHWMGAGGAWM